MRVYTKIICTIKSSTQTRQYLAVVFRVGPSNKFPVYETTEEFLFHSTMINFADPNHISRLCVPKDKGLKCSGCGAFGHKASECVKANSKPEVAILEVNFKPRLDNKIMIESISINSLVDTGSQVTLLRKSVFDELNVTELYPLNLSLNGIGKCKVNPFGYFKGNIQIE
ncbi:hypothetical protein HNY73_021328 [Argiope bruennichi]|uniref:CCHC-type domain-containing protein n=1 Tax=Argiope bruennichi TaxID=94029 RepID=A0A8T0DY89_ARGBR|nr:hypothetical protein HNY73_021328 [Argiope bruennichi]